MLEPELQTHSPCGSVGTTRQESPEDPDGRTDRQTDTHVGRVFSRFSRSSKVTRFAKLQEREERESQPHGMWLQGRGKMLAPPGTSAQDLHKRVPWYGSADAYTEITGKQNQRGPDGTAGEGGCVLQTRGNTLCPKSGHGNTVSHTELPPKKTKSLV